MIIKSFLSNFLVSDYLSLLPDLLGIQKRFFNYTLFDKNSYYYLGKLISNFFPFYSTDHGIRIEYHNISFKYRKYSEPYYSDKKRTRLVDIYVYVRFLEIKNIKDNHYLVKNYVQKRYLFCSIPCIMENGSFVINGIERTIVSQIYRSPGVYIDRRGRYVFVKIVPLRGVWLEIIINTVNKKLFFKLDRRRKIDLLLIIKCFQIDIEMLYYYFIPKKTLSYFNGVFYLRIKSSDFILGKKLFRNIYSIRGSIIARKGVTINECLLSKLSCIPKYIKLRNRVVNNFISSNDFRYNNFSIKKNSKVNFKKILYIIPKGEFSMSVYDNSSFSKYDSFVYSILDERKNMNHRGYFIRLFNYYNRSKQSNIEVSEKFFFSIFYDNYFLSGYVRNLLNKITKRESVSDFIEKEDIILLVKFLYDMPSDFKCISDVDNISNKRIRGSGHFLYSIIQKKMPFFVSSIVEKLSLSRKNDSTVSSTCNPLGDIKKVFQPNLSKAYVDCSTIKSKIDNFNDNVGFNYSNIVNGGLITNSIREFFCVSQFSQFLDCNNDLASITHKRRVTYMGPGGLRKDAVSPVIRDIHLSNYNKICPIETPEGKNIGLVNSLSIMACIDNDLCIISPYLVVKNGFVTNKPIYLSSLREFNSVISGALFDRNIRLSYLMCKKRNSFFYSKLKNIDYLSISQNQAFSLGPLFIPFMDHNDANRSLMGSNMQRQSLVCIGNEIPYVLSGFEHIPSIDLNSIYYYRCSKYSSLVYSDSRRFIIYNIISDKNILFKIVDFMKFSFSNQNNLLNNKLNDSFLFNNSNNSLNALNESSNTINGKVSLGCNLLVAFMAFEGYNFEDSIIVSEKVVNSDRFTSLHYNEVRVELDLYDNGMSDILDRDIFNIRNDNYVKLNKDGIGIVGLSYKPGDIIAAKLTPCLMPNLDPEEKLVNAVLKSFPVFKETINKSNNNRLLLNNVDTSSNTIFKDNVNKDIGISYSKGYNHSIYRKSYVNHDSNVILINNNINDDCLFHDIDIPIYIIINDKAHCVLSIIINSSYIISSSITFSNYNNLIKMFKGSQSFEKNDDNYRLKNLGHSNNINNNNNNILCKKNSYLKKFVRLDKDQGGLLTKVEVYNKDCSVKVIDGYSKCKNKNICFCLDIIRKKLISKTLGLIIKKQHNNTRLVKSLLFNKSKYRVEFKSTCFSCSIFIKYRILILNNRLKKLKILYNKEKKSLSKKVFLKPKNKKVIIFTFISKKKLSIGDKMSGRHGNKGVISKILPVEDMPHLRDGTPCDIILNPLGVPSRMNVGQILELKVGLLMFIIFKKISLMLKENNSRKKITKFLEKIGFNIGKEEFNNSKMDSNNIEFYKRNMSFVSPPFEGAKEKEINKIFKIVLDSKTRKIFMVNKDNDKLVMINGKSGYKFEKKISFGYMYFMKLHHISCDKIHSRSVGSYSLVTQQPLKGKSRFGGQRFGEMEVWALVSYGAAYTLQEMLTIKSDDIVGRKINFNRIIVGNDKKEIFVPECFHLLMKELKSLCIDVILQ